MYLLPRLSISKFAVFFVATSLAACAQTSSSENAWQPATESLYACGTAAAAGAGNLSAAHLPVSTCSGATTEDALLELPDAPSFESSVTGDAPANASRQADRARTTQNSRTPRFAPPPRAPLYNKYIEEGQTAQSLLGVRHKVLFGLDQIVSPYYLVSIVAAAGYEQALNGSPNYGTNIGAFGQRVGAAAATNASQSVFTDGVMPAVFHQDPRYYVKGRGHSVLARGAYAISRVFVTRSDSGDNAPNYSLFAGHAATAALQNAYYPPVNQGASESAKSYASSFAGTALSNGIREFFPDLLHLAHLE